MIDVLKGDKVPIKMWAKIEEVEYAALTQLKNISTLPFLHKHIAVMPDVHLGKGATVGSVIATEGAVIPAAVGVDIGCGMMAMQTNLTSHDFGDGTLKALRSEIERRVPVGHHGRKHIHPKVRQAAFADKIFYAGKASQKYASQCGTLGGGNHFIEVCVDTEDRVWIMLHSGSRNLGKTLAEDHIKNARKLVEMWKIHLVDKDLAYLPEGTPEFDAYVEDVQFAQDYAMLNREIMMGEVYDALHEMIPKAQPVDQINCHHNYLSIENHFGKNVLVTRKGAIRAREGDRGIIPGSMGTRSYIVRGLGNPDSFHSCSHGAGRTMSRTKAKEMFTVEDVIAQTEGVECRKDKNIIDEIPGAYKDIDAVMANQSDLVTIEATLKQVLCVKG